MNELKIYHEFRSNIHILPTHVALDVLLRINDWVVSGGKIEDEYVQNQIKYANKFINELKASI